jgi:ATP-binding cassette subfamily B protein
MLRDILNNKQKLRDFFADSAKGFLLIWNSGKKLTVVNFSLFVLEAIIPLLSLLTLKKLIDQVLKTGISWEHSGFILLWFAGLQLLNVVISQYSDYKLAQQQQLISDNIAIQVLNKAIELDLQYYENPAFYDELHMAQQQSVSKPAQLITACQGIVQNFITIVLFSGFMFIAHWSILLLIIALSVPLAISKLLHGYRQFQLDKNCMPAQRKAADLFRYLTTDAYAKEVRIFNFGANFISQFLHFRKYIYSKKKELNYKFLKQDIWIQFFEIAIVTAIYCIIIGSAIKGTITVGGLVIYFQVFQRLQGAIASLFQSGINLFQNQLYLREILKYLSAPSLVKNKGHFLAVPALSEGITVRQLNFVYPQTQRAVLKDINMKFAPGKITAIVGENGSGKTTLIKLLCRLYEVAQNTILMDGTDITEISPEELRKEITVLFQDFGKYYLTIEDNIALGNSKKDKNMLHMAADKAGLADKISSFPGGFKTHLGRTFKNGEQLSGGQWQKIALARGFYKNSKVLILDEPTSSMDPVAEHDFFLNLKNEIENKIVILITHRLYNLKMADYVYVLQEGSVAEHGPFNELLAAKSVFANMYDKQTI